MPTEPDVREVPVLAERFIDEYPYALDRFEKRTVHVAIQFAADNLATRETAKAEGDWRELAAANVRLQAEVIRQQRELGEARVAVEFAKAEARREAAEDELDRLLQKASYETSSVPDARDAENWLKRQGAKWPHRRTAIRALAKEG